MYRSSKAQETHHAILSYLREGEDSSLNEARVQKAIEALNEASLLELSIHGHSHLLDVLHLSHEIDPKHAGEKCKFLMQLLFSKAKSLGSKNLIQLLLQESHDGFSPLHTALKTGNLENMLLYFEEVRHAVTNQWMEKNEYINLLIKPNDAGFTPLHEAAYGNCIQVLTFFLDELKKLPEPLYSQALFAKTYKGFMPSCQKGKSDANKINTLLTQERKAYAKLTSSTHC